MATTLGYKNPEDSTINEVNSYAPLPVAVVTSDGQALATEERFTLTNISTNTTTVVKQGPGFLHCITVNTTAAGAVTIFDNDSGSGAKIGTMKASIAEASYFYDGTFQNGLTIVTAGASDLTVSWR